MFIHLNFVINQFSIFLKDIAYYKFGLSHVRSTSLIRVGRCGVLTSRI